MKRKSVAPLFLLLSLLVGAAEARTFQMVRPTSPVCGHEFTCLVVVSGTQTGMRLDLRQLGPTGAPWIIPVCPECHFVLYAKDIPSTELDKCRRIVGEDAYVKQAGRASHYLLGLLYEGLENDSLSTAHVFLQAFWQEECDEAKLKENLDRSLRQFGASLDATKNKKPHLDQKEAEPSYQMVHLLKAELVRRLGRFEEAKARLLRLRECPSFRDGLPGAIIRYQLDLCKKGDSRTHNVPEMHKEIDSDPPPMFELESYWSSHNVVTNVLWKQSAVFEQCPAQLGAMTHAAGNTPCVFCRVIHATESIPFHAEDISYSP